MAETPTRYVQGAVVAGGAAVVLDRVLSSRHVVEALEAMAARDPGLRAELEAMRDAVRRAAAEAALARVSGGGGVTGSAETRPGEGAPGSVYEIGTAEAARLLGLTERRVRQLAAGGLGRRVGGRWLLDRGLVMAYGQRRRAA
ncbi:hypothetical protein GCM10009527_009250 [Actinomadura nitritigenes]|uniref:Helix-turn-helix domain-containing protein n=1 Tax=Actinomadura nitritigenes TaxID=134602 RepID=A0ABS3R0N1_9ACTN|nr:hypothetical protein [Actinomadura nitritigenes]MBO2439804.1 hypothetical protein [Actinomadura nitritigenes]